MMLIFKTTIFKSGISDHFPIGVFLSPMVENNKFELMRIYKRIVNTGTIEIFDPKLDDMDWNEVKVCENASVSFKIYLTKFLCIYDVFFQKKKIKVQNKDIESHWITAGIKKP